MVVSNKCDVCLIRCRYILEHTLYAGYYLRNDSFFYCKLRTLQCNYQVNVSYLEVIQINRRSQYIIHPITQLRPVPLILSYTIFPNFTDIKFGNFSNMPTEITLEIIPLVLKLKVRVNIALAPLTPHRLIPLKVHNLWTLFSLPGIGKGLYNQSKRYFRFLEEDLI